MLQHSSEEMDTESFLLDVVNHVCDPYVVFHTGSNSRLRSVEAAEGNIPRIGGRGGTSIFSFILIQDANLLL